MQIKIESVRDCQASVSQYLREHASMSHKQHGSECAGWVFDSAARAAHFSLDPPETVATSLQICSKPLVAEHCWEGSPQGGHMLILNLLKPVVHAIQAQLLEHRPVKASGRISAHQLAQEFMHLHVQEASIGSVKKEKIHIAHMAALLTLTKDIFLASPISNPGHKASRPITILKISEFPANFH